MGNVTEKKEKEREGKKKTESFPPPFYIYSFGV
jgi:hypothetical protein